MADKPSRGVVLYGDGLARFLHPSHTNLHSLASLANCGFLSLPIPSPSESEDERAAREFAVLLDSTEAYPTKDEGQSVGAESQQLSERFMGMKAALLTKNGALKSFAEKIVSSAVQLDEFSASNVVTQLGDLLGFQDGKVLETNQFDLVLIHVGTNDEGKTPEASIEFVNALVGAILHMAEPGSEIGSRLHLSVVISYGAVSDDDDDDVNFTSLDARDGNNSDLSALFPRQSYTMTGESLRSNVRHHSPMLIAQWQYGVTRKDEAQSYSFKDFKQYGGNLTIPADRFLHEIAFKLWKASKYGA